MKTLAWIGTLAAAAALIAAAAQAQSPKTPAQQKESAAAMLTGAVNHANRECGGASIRCHLRLERLEGRGSLCL